MNRMLEVRLHEVAIGMLTMLPSRKIFFSFDEAYLKDPGRCILSQSFFRPSGALIPESKATLVRLPAFFSNLLPEGHLREYLARLAEVKSTEEFKLIELLGEDLPGAVSVAPLKTVKPKPSMIEIVEGNGVAQHPYRFSLAGVQLKFSAIAGASW
jgi:serine/threonine-protein kinase HipA